MGPRKLVPVVASVALTLAFIVIGAWQMGLARASPPPLAVQEGAPSLISFQGKLTDSGGATVPDGSYNLTFRIYDAATAGNLLWAETQTVTTNRGLFNVLFGAGTTLTGTLNAATFGGTDRWLEVVIEGQVLSPRQRFASVPYALQAQNSENLGGQPPSAYSPSDHTHWGQSWTGSGVALTLAGTNTSGAILQATNSGAGADNAAMRGIGGAPSGLSPGSKAGVWGDSDTGFGVYGSSWSGTGIDGVSWSGSGVSGVSGSGYGVSAASADSYAISAWSWLDYGMAVDGGAGDIRLLGTENQIVADEFDNSDLGLYSNHNVDIHLDDDANSTSYFRVLGGDNSAPFTLAETGATIITGTNAGGAILEVINVSPGSYGIAASGHLGDIQLLGGGGVNGRIYANKAPTSSLELHSNDSVAIQLDEDGDSFSAFSILREGGGPVVWVDESGNMSVAGDFGAGGTKTATVETEDYGQRKLYAMESPEVWFEDFGTVELSNGAAVVSIEPVFAQTVNLEASYRVFLTPLGDCGLYVAEKSPDSFTVRALGGRACSVAFDYRIVAKRAGYEGVRLERADG